MFTKLIKPVPALVLGVVLTLLAPLATAQYFGDSQAKLVVLEKVTFEYANRDIEAVGTAEAVRSVTLYPAVADEVVEINFVPGQYVEKDKVLMRLDDRRQQVAVRRAQLQLQDAQRSLERLQNTLNKGAVSQSELDVAQTERDLAQVNLDEAQADLDDRTVEAPFDGVVGLTDIEEGDRITTQTAITTLDNRTKLYVNFRAPEAALPILMNEPSVSLQPWTDREQKIPAQIAEIDSRINEVDRTMRARAILDNSKDKYRPGMSFRVRLSINGNRYAAIPEAALLWGANGAYVWISEEGKAKRVDVKVHQRLRGTILVSGDLEEGDLLISEGVQRLRNGQEVTTELARRSPQ
ncbi:efflux RND transporter periplasmic adaptor subunit [Salinimonas marina]|uniref:Efflux RND transporter periplasmic adaptor subunit n=1 Tax=Salinimonas marina TaxID=2785918 RepID=A0A7S9DVM3_9ALTE|nr:efflux RND transporter periplasmic adaptor subunit [Salinimonas marina]QPG04798.1 efflux RND transporter periplasmic adaptor subunit [Salinimonas marina]